MRGVKAVAFDQRTAILQGEDSLLDNFRRLNPGASDNAAHAALARFLFRADAALKLAADDPPQLLTLDEPTNHLDLDSIQAIEQALAAYDGALLIVSHDTDFLDAIGIERRIELSA